MSNVYFSSGYREEYDGNTRLHENGLDPVIGNSRIRTRKTF